MSIAPAPGYPERPGTEYERKVNDPRGDYNADRRGPLRFQEGVGTDVDVPNDFQKGIMQGYLTPPGRPNHNANVYEKWPEETLKERAHVGSASWVEAPDMLGEFAHGSFSDYAETSYEQLLRNGARQQRQSPSVVQD